MGVKELLKNLGYDSKHPLHSVDSLSGLTIGIDSMVLLTSFIKSDMRIVDKFYLGYTTDFDDELASYLNKKLAIFIELKCKLIFVIDGDRNPLKAETNSHRQDVATKAKDALDLMKNNPDNVDLGDVYKVMKETVTVSKELVHSLKVYCTSRNYQLVSACMEADPQLVALESLQIIDAIYTKDQDLVPLGAKRVIYLYIRVISYRFRYRY